MDAVPFQFSPLGFAPSKSWVLISVHPEGIWYLAGVIPTNRLELPVGGNVGGGTVGGGTGSDVIFNSVGEAGVLLFSAAMPVLK